MSPNRKTLPQLLAILICEHALVDDDKVASLIRIIDSFNFYLGLGDASQIEPEQVLATIQCYVFTRWGPGEGEFTEELRVVTPEGEELLPRGSVITFTKPPGFHFQQLRRRMTLGVNKSGTYKFRVYLDGELMGEHPFRVSINTEGGPPNDSN
jgi:hypothetical protein